MNSQRIHWSIVLLALAAFACTIPGTASPTPFVFPTPNLTLTAIYQPTSTPDGEPTLEATELVNRSTATPALEETKPAPTVTTEQSERSSESTVTATRFDQPPEIDGDFSDWPVERWSATEVVYGLDTWNSGSDLAASFALGWDNNNLYLSIQVNDDSHVQIASGRSLYKGDGVEILLDTSLQADINSTQLSSDDFQIGISPGDLISKKPEAYRWFPRSVEGSLSSLSIAAEPSDDGYSIEVKIPWIVFGVEPQAGDQFGLAISVSDNDLSGTAIQQSMVSNVASRVLTNPTTWGTLVLGNQSN